MLFIIIWLIVITLTGAIVISSPRVYGNPITMGITGGVLSGLYIMTYIFVKYYVTVEPMNEQLIIIQQPIIDTIPVASAVLVIDEDKFIETPINNV